MGKEDKRRVEKILFVTLSNIGDAILTTPAMGVLLEHFPAAQITVITSPAAGNLFEGNPFLHQVFIYNKFLKLSEKIKFFRQLRREKFDMVIDFKNTFLGFYLRPRYRMPFFRKDDKKTYKKDVFLNLLKKAIKKDFNFDINIEGVLFYIWTSEEDIRRAGVLLGGEDAAADKKIIAISPFARSDTKSWPFENFLRLIEKLQEKGFKIILVGAKEDEGKCLELVSAAGGNVYSLCGQTSLRVLAEVLRRSSCLITNDSAVMHLGSAVGTGVTAVFGPTDPQKYAPRGSSHRIITAGLSCQPCEKAQCAFGKKPADCLTAVSVDEVFDKVLEVMEEPKIKNE